MYVHQFGVFVFVSLCTFSNLVTANDSFESLANLYCGQDNCYDILEVPRNATASAIKKSYRRLALILHPDRKSTTKREQDEEAFVKIGKAYTVLSDQKMKDAYDHFLDNPGAAMYNYYYYYNAVYQPKTPIWIVILLTILTLSSLQYLNDIVQHSRVLRTVQKDRLFQMKVKERMCETVGGLSILRRMPETRLKALRLETEEIVLKNDVKFIGTGALPASVKRLLIVKLVKSPFTLLGYLKWLVSFWYRIHYCGQDYSNAEKQFYTRKALKLSEEEWLALEEDSRLTLLAKELWHSQNMKAYERNLMEVDHSKNVKSGAYKRQLRVSKKKIPYNYNDD